MEDKGCVERYPEVHFNYEGHYVTGRIVEVWYFPPTVSIILELTPGDESSRVELWAKSERLRGPIGDAFRAAGARTLEIGADLTVTFTGWDRYPYQAAKLYQARYARPKDEEAEARKMEEMREAINRVFGSAKRTPLGPTIVS